MTPPSARDWQGLILAGGRSRRMGRDKSLLPWGGRPVREHLRALLLEAGARAVHVVGGPVCDGHLPDRVADQGPLGGLASALPHLDACDVLVIPVDLPLLGYDALCPLLEATAAPAVSFADRPLPIRLRIDAALRQAIEDLSAAPARERSIRALFHHLGGVVLPVPDAAVTQLMNCNTPDEWAEAQRRYSIRQNASGGLSSTRPSSAK